MPPLLLLALVVLVGSLLSLVWAAPPGLVLGLIAVAAAAACRWPNRSGPLLGAALLVGWLAGTLRPPPPQPLPEDATLAFAAQVVTPPLPLGAGCRLAVDRVLARPGTRWVPLPGIRTLRLRGPCPRLEPGEWIQWLGHGPDPRPGGLAPTALRAPVDRLARLGRRAAPAALLPTLRHRALRRLEPWRDPGRAALAAVVLGDRAWLDGADRQALRITGTAHLLAISGLHVGLVGGLLFGVARRFATAWPGLVQRLAAPRVAASVALGGTWGFVLLAGAAPSAVRAGWMVTAWLLGHLAARRVDPLASLGLAVLGVTLWEPAHWATPGCQLSFAAVLGLLLAGRSGAGAEPHGTFLRGQGRPYPSPPHPVLERLRTLGWATTVATLATLPLAAYHFGQVTAAGLVTNLVAVPVMCSAVVPLGLLGLGLAVVLPGLGAAVIALAAQLADGLLGATALAAGSLGAPLAVALRPSALQTAAAYGLGAAWTLARRPGPARPLALALGLGAAVIGLGSLGAGALGPGGGTALRVELLAVGDGDAILVTLPDGRHGLVDAPGSGDPLGYAEGRLVAALRRRGVRRLAFVVATHGHADHVGGLPAVIAALPVEVVWHRGFAIRGPAWAPLRRAARQRGVALAALGDQRLAGVGLEILGVARAARAGVDPSLAENDQSLVLRLTHPAGAVLLAGDVERAGERALLRHPGPLGATVLKVAHHGSRSGTSAALLEAVRPAVALVSARAPRPGRPSPLPQLLGRLRARGILPLVTGLEGDVTVTLAPWGITLRTAQGRLVRLPPDLPLLPGPGPVHHRPLDAALGLLAPAAP